MKRTGTREKKISIIKLELGGQHKNNKIPDIKLRIKFFNIVAKINNSRQEIIILSLQDTNEKKHC